MIIKSLILLSFLCYLTFALSAIAGDLTVVHVKGKPKVERAGKSIEIKKGDLLKEGDEAILGLRDLLIAKNSDFMIKVSDDSFLKLKKLSKPFDFYSSKGSIVVNYFGPKSGGRVFTLTSKTASMGVRGTKFFTYVAGDKFMLVNVAEGKVTFKGEASEESLDIPSGQTAMTNEKKQTLAPKLVGVEDKINYEMDSTASDLGQPKSLYQTLDQVWDKYKSEQEYRWKAKLDDDEKKWEEFGKQQGFVNP